MMKALLMISMLALGYASPDTFRFTQCECPSFQFSSDQKNNFAGPLVKVGDPDLFNCPGNGAFPEESGVIFDLKDTQGELTTTVSTNLFQDNVAGVRNGWNAAFKVSFTPADGPDFNLIQIFDNNKLVFKIPVQLQVSGADVNVFIFPNSALPLQVAVTPDAENTLDVVVGEGFNANITEGGIPDFSFACASVNGNNIKCVTGVEKRQVSGSSVTMNFFTPSRFSESMPVKVLSAHFDNADTDDITVDNNEQLLNELSDIATETISQMPKVVSLPVVDEAESLTTDEDTPLSADFSNFLTGGSLSSGDLSFKITNNPNNGVINIDSSAFSYNPDKDFNGEDAFSFTYSISSPFACSNTVTSNITVVAENDPPVAKSFTFDVFATIGNQISAEIATDVDETDGKMNGKVTFKNELPGLISTSCESTDPVSELSVTDGLVSFCFTPDSSLVDATAATLQFTVADEDGLTDDGTIKFNGKNPVFPAAESPIESGRENTVLSFSLGGDRYGVRAPGALEGVRIGIRVTKIPDVTLGALKDSKDELVDLDSNSDFTDFDILKFVPNSQIFNAVEGSPVDASGELFGSCTQRVAIGGKDGFCPISFEYKVFLEGVESEAQEAFFLINAVDDGNPTIEVSGKQNEIVTVSKSPDTEDLGQATISNVKITSDDGGNAFPLNMNIEGTNQAQFLVGSPENRKGLSVFGGKNENENVQDCSKTLCTSVKIRGTPKQLMEITSLSNIQMPLTAVDPKLTIQVSTVEDSENEAEISVSFNIENENSGSQASNAGGIIGGSVGVVAIVAGVAFVLTRKKEQKRKSVKIMEGDLATEDGMETRMLAPTGSKPSAEKDESKPNDEKDELDEIASTDEENPAPVRDLECAWERCLDSERHMFYYFNQGLNAVTWSRIATRTNDHPSTRDERSFEELAPPWEAHRDRQTGETFYLNPTTGDLQWRPPQI